MRGICYTTIIPNNCQDLQLLDYPPEYVPGEVDEIIDFMIIQIEQWG